MSRIFNTWTRSFDLAHISPSACLSLPLQVCVIVMAEKYKLPKKKIKTMSVSDIFMFNPEIKLIHWKTETDIVAHFKYTSRAIQRGLHRGSLQL
jgi:hypothetical protein